MMVQISALLIIGNGSAIWSVLRDQSAKVNFGAVKDQIILQLKILYFSRE